MNIHIHTHSFSFLSFPSPSPTLSFARSLSLFLQEKAQRHYARASELNPTFASADREAAIAATVMSNYTLAEFHLRCA